MTSGSRYMGEIARMQCVVCVRFVPTGQPVEVHHVAEGSGKRSPFATAPLCAEHHRGKTGLHGMGPRRFCSAYRLPGETEWGLLVWVNEDRARFRVAA